MTTGSRAIAWVVMVGLGLASGSAQAQEKVLKIGQIGVMSGPAAAWGLINKYAAQAQANMINHDGGFDIGGVKYKILVASVDDKMDPRVAIAGTERLIHEDGIKYIIGPNVDEDSRAIIPVLAKGGAFNI